MFRQSFPRQKSDRTSLQVQRYYSTARVDHPGMTEGILSKTGMGYKGTRNDLVRAHGCTHRV